MNNDSLFSMSSKKLLEIDPSYIYRLDFSSFAHRAFNIVNPGKTFSAAPYTTALAQQLQMCTEGQCQRLIVNLPPRSSKSFHTSVAFVAFYLGLHPEAHVMCLHYGQDLAEFLSIERHVLMTSNWYRSLFPDSVPVSGPKTDFRTAKGGGCFASSIYGPITGRGADLLIIDDPVKPMDMRTQEGRERADFAVENQVFSRLDSKKIGIIITVMQRVHIDDLTGRLMEKGDWTLFSQPAIATEDVEMYFKTSLRSFPFRRKRGEALDASREPIEVLEKVLLELGRYAFEAQYQQNPIPMDGQILLSEWFRYYDPESLPPNCGIVYESWDTAHKDGDLNDYSACVRIVVWNGKWYITDAFRRKMKYPDLKNFLLQRYKANPNITFLIENKGSGISLIQDLKSEGCTRIKACDPGSVGKAVRLSTQSTAFENGMVYLPTNAPWLREYVNELISFPQAKHDDWVDATVQALEFLNGKKKGLQRWEAMGRKGVLLPTLYIR